MEASFKPATTYLLKLERLFDVSFRISPGAESNDERLMTGRQIVELIKAGRSRFESAITPYLSIDGAPALFVDDDQAAAAALLSSLFIEESYVVWPRDTSADDRRQLISDHGTFFYYLGHEDDWSTSGRVPTKHYRYFLLALTSNGERDEPSPFELTVTWSCLKSDRLEEYFEPFGEPSPDRAFTILLYQLLASRGATGQRRRLEIALKFASRRAILSEDFLGAAPSADAIVIAASMQEHFEKRLKHEQWQAQSIASVNRTLTRLRFELLLLACAVAVLVWRVW